jgi:hypothetical protein
VSLQRSPLFYFKVQDKHKLRQCYTRVQSPPRCTRCWDMQHAHANDQCSSRAPLACMSSKKVRERVLCPCLNIPLRRGCIRSHVLCLRHCYAAACGAAACGATAHDGKAGAGPPLAQLQAQPRKHEVPAAGSRRHGAPQVLQGPERAQGNTASCDCCKLDMCVRLQMCVGPSRSLAGSVSSSSQRAYHASNLHQRLTTFW